MNFLPDLIRAFNQIDAPTVVLLLMMLFGIRAAQQAQKREDFDWGEAFRDDKGKVDWKQGALLVSVGISSWVLIYCFMNGIRTSDKADELVKVLHELFWYFAVYMILWGIGPRAAERTLDAVVAKWSGGSTTTTNSSMLSSTTTRTGKVPKS